MASIATRHHLLALLDLYCESIKAPTGNDTASPKRLTRGVNPVLSPGLDNSTGNSTATRQVARQVARQLLDRTPLTPCDGGVKCQARQLDSSTDLIRTRQTSTEPSRYGPAC